MFWWLSNQQELYCLTVCRTTGQTGRCLQNDCRGNHHCALGLQIISNLIYIIYLLEVGIAPNSLPFQKKMVFNHIFHELLLNFDSVCRSYMFFGRVNNGCEMSRAPGLIGTIIIFFGTLFADVSTCDILCDRKNPTRPCPAGVATDPVSSFKNSQAF